MGNGRRSFAPLIATQGSISEHYTRKQLQHLGEEGSGWTMTWKRVSTSGAGPGLLGS